METLAVHNESDTDFERFLRFAKGKGGSQCVCAVVCEAQILEDAGGISLSPVTCIDKVLEHVGSYQDLINAGGLIGHDWEVMCITMLEGQTGQTPTAIETNKRLDVMLEFIRQGKANKLVIFDRNQQFIKLPDY